MDTQAVADVFDYLIIGSGSAGATLARELSASGKRVLILERGQYVTLSETLWTTASILKEVKVAHKLKDPRVFAAGGTSAVYLAVADTPPIDAFREVGVDLTQDYEWAKRELPLCEMPDEILSPQAKHLRAAALEQGYQWKKNTMLIDRTMCEGAYSYEAKWKALSYVEDALRNGAKLQCGAIVERVVIENNVAVGVECRIKVSLFRSRIVRYYASRIILSAGSLVSPQILQKSGLKDVVADGYYLDPSIALIGRVPGLKGSNSFAATMGLKLEDGTSLLDANLHKFFFYMGTLQSFRPLRMFSYGEHVSIMVKAYDAVSGTLSSDGRYHKELDAQSLERLRHGEEVARSILINAGAKDIFKTPLMTGGAFGTLRIQRDVDSDLQTSVKNLYVCDGSLIPPNARVTPTLTLVCLAKYLTRRLLETSAEPVASAGHERASADTNPQSITSPHIRSKATLNTNDTNTDAAKPATSQEAVAKAPKAKRSRWEKAYIVLTMLLIVGTLADYIWKLSGSDEWVLQKDEKGVKIYSLKAPGDKTIKVKAVMEGNYTLSQLAGLHIIDDNLQTCQDWFPNCTDFTRIKEFDTVKGYDTDMWRLDFPFPFKDRELLIDTIVSQDKETKTVVLDVVASPNTLPHTSDTVRIERMHNRWEFKPLPNGKVEVLLIQDTEMGGLFPYFLLNMVAVDQNFIFFSEELPGFLKKDKYVNLKLDFIEDIR